MGPTTVSVLCRGISEKRLVPILYLEQLTTGHQLLLVDRVMDTRRTYRLSEEVEVIAYVALRLQVLRLGFSQSSV